MHVLQELILMASVQFFSKDDEQLGNKTSLERHIHEITGTPIKVLLRGPLSDFGVTERILWADKRETTRQGSVSKSITAVYTAVF